MITFGVNMPAAGSIELSIYDTLGREVYTTKNEGLGAGLQQLQWNTRSGSGSPLPGGLYLYRIRANTPLGIQQTTNSLVVTR